MINIYRVFKKEPRFITENPKFIYIEPQAGEVVLLKDNVPRGSWKLARIVELISSNDGKVQSARVMLPTKKILSCPLSLLYPLETSGTRVQNTDVNLEGDNLSNINGHTESEHTKEESEINDTLKWLP